jgi:hypothetical protein
VRNGAGKGDDLAAGKTGATRMSGRAAGRPHRVIGDEHIAVANGAALAAIDLQDTADQVPVDRRMEEHRRRHDQPPVTVKDHAAEVA